MARFALVYGLRLVPAERLKSTQSGTVVLKDGSAKGVTLHVIEGDREQIRARLDGSIDAFFEVFDEMLE
ncbi:MAG: allantoinase [Planctomycetota bacterium]